MPDPGVSSRAPGRSGGEEAGAAGLLVFQESVWHFPLTEEMWTIFCVPRGFCSMRRDGRTVGEVRTSG